MLIVALIFSFAAVIGKKGMLHSSPMYFTISFFLIFNFLLTLFLLSVKKIQVKTFTKQPYRGIISGLLFYGSSIIEIKANNFSSEYLFLKKHYSRLH